MPDSFFVGTLIKIVLRRNKESVPFFVSVDKRAFEFRAWGQLDSFAMFDSCFERSII